MSRTATFLALSSLVLLAALVAVGCREGRQLAVDGLAMDARLPPGAVLTRDEAVDPGRILVWKGGRDVLAIHVHQGLDAAQVATLVGNKKMLMEGLFRTHPSPYPGALSNTQPCDPAYLPVTHDRDDARGLLKAWETTANDRLVIGGCTGENTTMRAVYALLYCPDARALHEVRFFTPRERPSIEPLAFIEALTCAQATPSASPTRASSASPAP